MANPATLLWAARSLCWWSGVQNDVVRVLNRAMLSGNFGGNLAPAARRFLAAVFLAGAFLGGGSVEAKANPQHEPGSRAWFRGRRALPRWFVENRVQGHTRVSIFRWLEQDEFGQTAAAFRDLGARAFTRHVKTGEEDPWWPSRVPLGPSGEPLFDGDRFLVGPGGGSVFLPAGRDVVVEMVDEARREGERMIAYFWHMSDARLAALHPEWVCRDVDGDLAATPRGVYVDITSPFREVVLQRLLELAARGVDGFYFDFQHMPPNGCWGTAFARTFQAVTGFAPPTTNRETDPVYRRFLDFQARKIEETFDYWRKHVKEEYPKKVFLVSTTFVPTLVNRRMTTRLASLADSSKTEYRLALAPGPNLRVFERDPSLATPEDDIRMALGWTLLRDSADGRPPHVWAPGFPNQDHTLAFVASVLTYGGIANVDASERNLLATADPPGATPRAALQAAFALGDIASPHLAHLRPVRWAAVHFSEEARNRRGGDHSLAWREVLWPVTGAYGVFVRLGLPVGMVNDAQLAAGELDGYRLLVLSGLEDLSEAQERQVQKFLARGGKIIVNRPEWRWSDPLANDAAEAAFREVVERIRDAVPARVQVVGGAEKMHSVAYRGKGKRRLVVATTNEFGWVQTQTVRNIPDVVNPTPPPVRGASVVVRSHRLPARVQEAVTGIFPRVTPMNGGFKVTLPEFQTLSILVMEWDGPPRGHTLPASMPRACF